MPPPARPVTKKPLGSQSQRISFKGSREPSVTESDPDPESLFVPGGDDDDQTWDPPNYDNEEEEEMLGWDAGNEAPDGSFHPTFRDSGTVARPPQDRRPPAIESQEGLEPTQRLSQVRFHVSVDARPGLTSVAARHVRLSASLLPH